jgi:hypothetical protein
MADAGALGVFGDLCWGSAEQRSFGKRHPLTDHAVIYSLTQPHRLYTRAEVLAHPSPVLRAPGLYAWFFREVPPGIPTAGGRTNH